MPLDIGNPWDDLSSPSDASVPKLDINTRDGKLQAYDPGGSGFELLDVRINALLALDIGHIMTGREWFKPTYGSQLVPLGGQLPAPPSGVEITPTTRIQVWVQGYGGLRVLRIRGKIHLGRFKNIYLLSTYRTEAQQGLIPTYVFKGFEDIQTSYGVYKGILLEPHDFIERDEEFFGSRLIPPPAPMLASSPQPKQLPPGASAEPPPEQPKETPVGFRPVPSSPPPTAPKAFSQVAPVQPAGVDPPAVPLTPKTAPVTSRGVRKPY